MSGAAGRMGRAIIALSAREDSPVGEMRLAGALEGRGHPLLSKDAGETAGAANLGVPILADAGEAFSGAKAVIDFSTPEACLNTARACREMRLPLVVGSTGLNESEREELLDVARDIPLLWAPNMSVGVNLLFYLVAQAAEILGSGYDVEVVEAHHRFKKDAPSGTAVRLKEILLETLQREEDNVIYGRKGADVPRRPNEIGVHTIRGGDTVGEHTAYFFTDGERIELTHRASSRDTFAQGALRAALFLTRVSGPGLYHMKDVLNLK